MSALHRAIVFLVVAFLIPVGASITYREWIPEATGWIIFVLSLWGIVEFIFYAQRKKEKNRQGKT